MLKFGTKNVLLDIFDQTFLIWVFLGQNFQKTMVIFEISTPRFAYLQNLARKKKGLNLEAKMSYLGIFGKKNQKTIVYLKSAPSNLSICKSRKRIKMPKDGTKNALFGHFRARIFKKLLSYFKSATSNLFICKILRKK